MNSKNNLVVKFPSLSKNEGLARNIVSLFALELNPSISEISDIKTAVSEAVTNCIVHGFPKEVGEITLKCEIIDDKIHINISDNGVGIKDLKEALEPFYTTQENNEHSGMGFTIMKSFMDEVIVKSEEGNGTEVYMIKKINKIGWQNA